MHILPGGPDVVGVLLDISEGGCGIEVGMAIPAPMGARVKVDLFFSGLTLSRIGILRNMQVIRHVEKETRAGIEFIGGIGLSSEQFHQLTKGEFPLVERNPSKGNEPPKRSWWMRLSGLVG